MGGSIRTPPSGRVIAFAALGDGDKAAELLAMLNPITPAATPHGVQRYRVEPYVVVGDIYSEAPHVGRGGWTWYTGSAGWLDRAGIEWLLGIRVQGTRLVVNPCIPSGWPGFTVAFRYRSARYDIAVENSGGVWDGRDRRPFRTGNGNLIVDCAPPEPMRDGRAARALERALLAIIGVVDTGLYLGTADRVLVGSPDGRADTLRRAGGRAA